MSAFPVLEAVSFLPVTSGVSIDHSTSMDFAKTFVGVSYWLYLGNKEFYHNTLFVLTSLTNSIVTRHSSSAVLSVENFYNFVHKYQKVKFVSSKI